MMVTKMKDCVTLDDKDNDADFRYDYRDNMIAQFEKVLYNKSLSRQDHDKRHDGLQTRIKFWLKYVVKMGGPTPDSNYDYDYSDLALGCFLLGSKYDPWHKELKNCLIKSNKIESENN